MYNLEQYMNTDTDTDTDKNYHLEALKSNINSYQPEGYPDKKYRLVINFNNLDNSPTGNIILPDGPWNIGNYRNSPHYEYAPSEEKQLDLVNEGLQLDSIGRPIHPWFKDMVNDKDIGVLTGIGAYWHWGPNYTADPVIISDGKVLLIKRADSKAWALPGGFIEPYQTSKTAALAEASQETGIILDYNVEMTEVYNGIVADVRTTANAWPITTAYLIKLNVIPELINDYDKNEVDERAWFDINEALNKYLYGSHNLILKKALELI